MRILHVIQELNTGGAERVVLQLAVQTRRRGHDVAVVSNGGRLVSHFPGPAFTMPLVNRKATNVLHAARSLRRALRSFYPDVIHAHNPSSAVVCRVAMPLSGPALVITVHGLSDNDYRRAATLLRLARGIAVACGPGVASGLDGVGIHSVEIPNGVSPSEPLSDPAVLREQLSIPDSLRIAAVVGRLTPAKNQIDVLRALPMVDDVVLLVVGGGPRQAQLVDAADTLGVTDRVRFLGDRDDARCLIALADVLVSTSVSEGLPMTMLEAFAAGTPVVAYDARGVGELIRAHGGGLLTAHREPADLAAMIRRVLCDVPLARQLAEEGLAASAVYSEAAMVDAYLRLYAHHS